MSEIPERKVLKEILPKLKLKAMNSENRFEQSATITMSNMVRTINDLKQQMEKTRSGREKALGVILLAVANDIYNTTNMLIITARNVLEDLKIYIDSLEKYSMELDKTLTDIFEQVKKKVEEEQKRQEELSKKKPTFIQ